MVQMKFLLLALIASVAGAFAPSSGMARQATQLQESFLGIGEDTFENQPDLLKGEAEYKQYMNKVKEDNMLNRKYNVIRRVRELNLLQATVDSGVLTKLENNGLDLVTIEKLLPLAEELGLLGLVANNQQLLVNGIAPLLVEAAPFALPVVAGALEIGPPAFFAVAAAAGGLQIFFLVNGVTVPLVGLQASFLLGLVLVPVAAASGAAGVALASLNKK